MTRVAKIIPIHGPSQDLVELSLDTEGKEKQEYPRETAAYLSWASLQFIRSPSSAVLQWTVVSMVFCLLGAGVLSYFIEIDVSIPVSGEVIPHLRVQEVVSIPEGVVDELHKNVGDHVNKDDIIANVSLDRQSLEEIQILLLKLDSILSLRDPFKNSNFEHLVFPSAVIELPLLVQSLTDVQNFELAWRSQPQSLKLKNDLFRSATLAKAHLELFLKTHQLRAHTDGVMLKLLINPLAHVNANQTVALIEPAGSIPIASFKVASTDITRIKTGQKIYYKLEAYPFREYGLFQGEVQSFELYDFTVKGTLFPNQQLPPEVSAKVKLLSGMKFDATLVTERKPIAQVIIHKLFSH